jgi:ribose transport system substrate-binding protein
MKTTAWKVSAVLSVMAGLLVLAGGCGKSDTSTPTANGGGATTEPSAAARLTIGVIPKGTTHEYWKSVQKGANAAGAELGVNIDYQGPLKEGDLTGEQNLFEQFTADKYAGIVLAPQDAQALLADVQAATARKISVVIIDSALNGTAGTDYASYVSTNNRVGGQMAGAQMIKLLGGKGKVVMLRYASNSASTNEREAGFLDALKAAPGIDPFNVSQYGQDTESSAQQVAENMVDALKQADGIFCPNESTTMGMLKALQDNNLTGKVKFVGFDATGPEVDALKAGQIQALISQNPFRMGYLGVKTCVAAIRGEKFDTQIDSGVELVTPDNVNTPDMVKFLAGG